MNKRGFSHIEVVMSFVIFIGVVFFALYFLGSTNSARVTGDDLGLVQDEIERTLESKFSSFNVGVKENVNVMVIELEREAGQKSVVYNENNLIDSKHSGDLLFFGPVINGEIYRVIVGNDIDYTEASLNTGVALDRDKYNLGSVVELNALSEERALTLKDDYDLRYDELKERFRVGFNTEFGFKIVFEDGVEIVAERNVPQGDDVFLDKKRFEFLRSDGKVEFGELEVKTWS